MLDKHCSSTTENFINALWTFGFTFLEINNRLVEYFNSGEIIFALLSCS